MKKVFGVMMVLALAGLVAEEANAGKWRRGWCGGGRVISSGWSSCGSYYPSSGYTYSYSYPSTYYYGGCGSYYSYPSSSYYGGSYYTPKTQQPSQQQPPAPPVNRTPSFTPGSSLRPSVNRTPNFSPGGSLRPSINRTPNFSPN